MKIHLNQRFYYLTIIPVLQLQMEPDDGGLEVHKPLKPLRRRLLWGISPLESIKPSLEAAEYLINAQMQDK